MKGSPSDAVKGSRSDAGSVAETSPERRGAWPKRRRSVAVCGRSIAVLATLAPKRCCARDARAEASLCSRRSRRSVAVLATLAPKRRCARDGEAEASLCSRRRSRKATLGSSPGSTP
nr:hypothetical protein CFP56_60807 [Quercus suber]